ncbi:TRAF-interacting protein [Papilio machaon]|uniref:TRAF-interacting protein n=1 Tax=Papilio machaon TaxID=76193 RepID=A0A0N0PBX7_PAPMA|nr:TRAF-interacting protein [Papilio machaon]
MHMLCSICNDLLNQTESIYAIKCGHMFHHNCLAQWIARSKSCPQCRNKVTEKCMFRLYPTICNDNTGDDAATLQSRLDNVQLQLHEQKSVCKEKEEKLNSLKSELATNKEMLSNCEQRLVQQESAITALKEYNNCLKVESKKVNALREENQNLKKNISTMHRLQKVLNATSSEVETMLEGYSDVKTVAVFATALKRALCESEAKKNELRNRLDEVTKMLVEESNKLADARQNLRLAEDEIQEYRLRVFQDQKRDAAQAFGVETENSTEIKVQKLDQDAIKVDSPSVTTLVDAIENSDSPYLRLKQSTLALAALQQRNPPAVTNKALKPSEFGILKPAKSSILKKTFSTNTSIFHKKEPARLDLENNDQVINLDVTYDGLGGHSKPSFFPVTKSPKPRLPKLTAKHKLRRPTNTTGSRDISKMFEKLSDGDS